MYKKTAVPLLGYSFGTKKGFPYYKNCYLGKEIWAS